MNVVICPFCGVVSEVRHETEEACIEALQTEIARTRRVLEQTSGPPRPRPVAEDTDPQPT